MVQAFYSRVCVRGRPKPALLYSDFKNRIGPVTAFPTPPFAGGEETALEDEHEPAASPGCSPTIRTKINKRLRPPSRKNAREKAEGGSGRWEARSQRQEAGKSRSERQEVRGWIKANAEREAANPRQPRGPKPTDRTMLRPVWLFSHL